MPVMTIPGFMNTRSFRSLSRTGYLTKMELMGRRVALVADNPSPLPYSGSKRNTFAQRGAVLGVVGALAGLLRGQDRPGFFSNEDRIPEQRVAGENLSATPPAKRRRAQPSPPGDGAMVLGSQPNPGVSVGTGVPKTGPTPECSDGLSLTNSEYESAMNHRLRKEALRHPLFS
uniref:Predicted protein n=1 Tax=Hordeum vulgare subsp. vulgare TaxID=112509 RepID=F2CZH4_HORVV|nr:predicted protein [Hordeum vulgare subsp. vulgare]